jgi:hypothetical protein
LRTGPRVEGCRRQIDTKRLLNAARQFRNARAVFNQEIAPMPVPFVNRRHSLAAEAARNRTPLTIIVAPAVDRIGRRIPDRWDVRHGDRHLVHSTRTPLLDGARVLLDLGTDPAATVLMKHIGSDIDCLHSTVGAAAKLVVEDDRFGRPVFRRIRRRPPSDGAAPPVRFQKAGVVQGSLTADEASGGLAS